MDLVNAFPTTPTGLRFSRRVKHVPADVSGIHFCECDGVYISGRFVYTKEPPARFALRPGDIMAIKAVCAPHCTECCLLYITQGNGILDIGIWCDGAKCAKIQTRKRERHLIDATCAMIRDYFVRHVASRNSRSPHETINIALEEWSDLPIEVGRSVLLEFIDDTMPPNEYDPRVISYFGSVTKEVGWYTGSACHCIMATTSTQERHRSGWYIGPYSDGTCSVIRFHGDFTIFDGPDIFGRHNGFMFWSTKGSCRRVAELAELPYTTVYCETERETIRGASIDPIEKYPPYYDSDRLVKWLKSLKILAPDDAFALIM
jgi:hypothetical protein